MNQTLESWEYLVEPVAGQVDAARLNDLGSDYWELIAVVPTTTGRQQLIFKRPGPGFRERVTLDQRATVARSRDAGGHEGDQR